MGSLKKTDPKPPLYPLSKMTRVKLAFVLDCTASMGPWIHAAKTKIREIIDECSKTHNQASFKVGLVAYRDHGDNIPMRVCGFASPEDAMMVLHGMNAEGGDDIAEDVSGAFHHLLRGILDWSHTDVKLVFHITDAPAHGLKFHPPHISDRFPQGDPTGNDPCDFLREMSDRGFYYTFVRIKSATDQMLDVFHKAWGNPGTFDVIDLKSQDVDMFSPMVSRSVSMAIDHYTSSQGT
jgi:hypothetical protein